MGKIAITIIIIIIIIVVVVFFCVSGPLSRACR
jgi:hypothetical protein